MIFVIITGIVIFSIVLIRNEANKPHVYTDISRKRLKEYFYVLLYRGINGSILEFKNVKNNHSLLFGKYLDENKKSGIKFFSPFFANSNDFENKIKNVLIETEFNFFIEKPNNNEIREVLLVDLDQNVDEAVDLANLLLLDFFNSARYSSVEVHFEDIAAIDQIIGFKEKPNFTELGVDIGIPVIKGEYWGEMLGIKLKKIYILFKTLFSSQKNK